MVKMTDYQIEMTVRSMRDKVRNRVSLFGGGEEEQDAILLAMAADAYARANQREYEREGRLAEARMMGHQAAMSLSTWLEMSEKDALSIVNDIDPEVMDCYPGPNLSGEHADSPTPTSLLQDLQAPEVEIDEIARVWLEEAEETWSLALAAEAHRVLDNTETAYQLEEEIEMRRLRLEDDIGFDT